MSFINFFSDTVPNIIIPILLVFLALKIIPTYRFHLKLQSNSHFFVWLVIAAITLNCISICILYSINILTAWISCPEGIFLISLLTECSDFLKKILSQGLFIKEITTLHLINIVLSASCVVFFMIYRKIKPTSYAKYVQNRRRKALGSLPKLEQLFMHAFNNFIPIMITLKNRKVYIGWIKDYQTLNIDNKGAWITIFLIASGYRSTEKLHFKIENDYRDLIRELVENEDEETLKKLSNGIVFPQEEIISAVLWMEDIYNNVNSKA